MLSFVMLIIKL